MLDFNKYKVTGKAVRKEVTVRGLQDEVFVKRLPAVDMRQYHAELTSSDTSVRANAGLDALVKSICDGDGKPATSYDELRSIDLDLMKELVRVFQEVNIGEADTDLGNA